MYTRDTNQTLTNRCAGKKKIKKNGSNEDERLKKKSGQKAVMSMCTESESRQDKGINVDLSVTKPPS